MEKRSKKVWIINQYSNLPSVGIGGRHYYLSKELASLGFSVTNIAARWSHVMRDFRAAGKADSDEFVDGFRFLRISVVKYKHAHDKRRVLNWFIFAWRLRKLPKMLDERPDVILYSSPSLIGYLTAYRLANKYDARLIFEVRDIWPLTLIQLGGFSPRHPFIRFIQWIEDFAYKKSDHVISNLEGAAEHARSRGLCPEKFSWIPNGFSEAELGHVEPANREILQTIKEQPFSVTYTGAIGEANSLDTLIDAAKILKGREDVFFNIVGRGRLASELQKKAQSMGLTNISFWGAVPKGQVQSILRASDVSVICWRDSALYKHGLAANKLFDYLYAGRPIINAYSGGYDIIERYQAGLTVPAEDPKALAQAIESLLGASAQELFSIGQRGRSAALEYHEYGKIASSLSKVLTGEVSP